MSISCTITSSVKKIGGETTSREIDVTCEPHTVSFEDGKRLNVDIKIKNVPNGQTLFQNVFLYDSTGKEGAIHNFKVGDYIRNEYRFGIKQNVAASWNNKTVRVCLMSKQNKDCDILDRDFIVLKHAKTVQASACTNDGCLLTYDWSMRMKNCSSTSLPHPPDVPKIKLVYDSQKWKDRYYVNITCSSRMNKFDLLYLYQYPKEPGDSPLLLHMKQYLEKTTGHENIRFYKKLQNDDKRLKVFCVRESIDNSTYKRSEDKYLFTVDAKIFDDLEPSVINVSPAVAWFDPGDTLSFVCSGTPAQEGRELTWYIQDSNTSTIELPDSDGQKYDPEANQNILTLRMNETLLTNKLFCAEDFHIQIKYPESNFTLKRYGIRNESAVVLKLREEEVKVPVQPLIWGVAGGGAVLLLAILFILRARSRRQQGAPADGGHEGNEEGYYSTAQVKYVVLDLPQAQSGKPEQREDPSPYAKIVGVYNPGK